MQAELKTNTTQRAATPLASKRTLGLIFFIMLMDIVGLTIIIPVAPFVVGRYSNDALMVTLLTVIYFSTMATLTTNRVTEREQGVLAGVNASLAALMSAVGPLFAGVVYDNVILGAPYWIGAIVLAFAALLMTRVRATRLQPARS